MNPAMPERDSWFEIPGGWCDHLWEYRGVRLKLTLPADPDRVLDEQVAALQAGGVGEDTQPPDPYWVALWSAATPTAEAVLRAAAWPAGTRVLELGCGIGLVGLAALTRGAQVTFSDHTPLAVRVAVQNARQNGFQAQSQVFDWHDPPKASFDVILASDILYEREAHEPLLRAIDRLMAAGGVCWIGDPGRAVAQEFYQLAAAQFDVQAFGRNGDACEVAQVGEFQRLVLQRVARTA